MTKGEGIQQWIQNVFIPAVKDESNWPEQLGKWLRDRNLTYSRLAHGQAYFEEMDARTFKMMYAHEDASYLITDIRKIYRINNWQSEQLREFWGLVDKRLLGAFGEWKAVVAETGDEERALRGIIRLAVALRIGFEVLDCMKDDRNFPGYLMAPLLDALSRLQIDDHLCDWWKMLLQQKKYPRFSYAAWHEKMHEHDMRRDDLLKKSNIRLHDDKRTYQFGVVERALRGLLSRVDRRAQGTPFDVQKITEQVGEILHPIVCWAKNNVHHMQISQLVYERFGRSCYGYREKSGILTDIFYERLYEFGVRRCWPRQGLQCFASLIQFVEQYSTW